MKVAKVQQTQVICASTKRMYEEELDNRNFQKAMMLHPVQTTKQEKLIKVS